VPNGVANMAEAGGIWWWSGWNLAAQKAEGRANISGPHGSDRREKIRHD
jgi:hypothetical protein